MSKTNEDKPQNYQKKKEGETVGFKSPSRFSGGSMFSKFGTKSQYKPMPVRITQHKG